MRSVSTSAVRRGQQHELDDLAARRAHGPALLRICVVGTRRTSSPHQDHLKNCRMKMMAILEPSSMPIHSMTSGMNATGRM